MKLDLHPVICFKMDFPVTEMKNIQTLLQTIPWSIDL
jgi:hypothetical protein